MARTTGHVKRTIRQTFRGVFVLSNFYVVIHPVSTVFFLIFQRCSVILVIFDDTEEAPLCFFFHRCVPQCVRNGISVDQICSLKTKYTARITFYIVYLIYCDIYIYCNYYTKNEIKLLKLLNVGENRT